MRVCAVTIQNSSLPLVAPRYPTGIAMPRIVTDRVDRHSASSLCTVVIFAFVDSELLESLSHRAKDDAQQPRRALAYPTCLLECAQDPRALVVADQLVEIDALGGQHRRRLRGGEL